MKEELLKQFTTRLIHYVDSAEIFLQGNVPDYVEQLLHYEMFHNLILLGIGGVVFIIIAIISRSILKYMNKTERNDDDDAALVLFLLIMFFPWLIWFFCGGVSSINNIVKIKTAPKVFVIDYLKNNISK